MPRLSVLLPAYNAAGTLARAVRSTLRALPRDAEVVVLDDGSEDATAAVARSILDHRVRVLSHSNAGVATTLNDLLAATDSELVARMDADDVVLPGRFQQQLRAVDAGADAIFTTVVGLGSGHVAVPRPSGISAADFGLHLLLTNPVAHSTLLARRSSISGVGGYRNLPTEDYDLWLRMCAHGVRLQRLALPGLAYRQHPGQITASAAWRRSSWENRDLGAAYSSLAECTIGAPMSRITTLSIDDSLSPTEKRAKMSEFADLFSRALNDRPAAVQRALRRKLTERRCWLESRLAEPASGKDD